MSPSPKHKDWLRPLADLLIARHINVSLPEHELRREIFESDTELWKRCQRKFRCIAVVGAGASAPALARGDQLASGLIEKFNIGQASVEAERDRLERITAVDPSEFEAQLSAIGQTLGNSRRVRAAISDLYRVRQPTVLAYELLAHLLKHRFIDAIISMNFDELLDQSLDDELGIGEYARIVSDRDCVNANSDVFSPDYIPLYIKLHGTASEPESLRFTRESYYDSPVQVGTEAARLFQVPECVVLNIGFGMASFDLHRLLAIPDELWLYNLSHDPLSNKARSAIERERERHGRTGTTEFRESPDNEKKFKAGTWPEDEEKSRASYDPVAGTSDQMMDDLLGSIQASVKSLSGGASSAVTLRPVERHQAVVSLLGPNSKPGKRLKELASSSEDARVSLDPLSRAARPDAVKAGYLLRRTTLELVLAMARGRGLVSIATLAVDRCGQYYDEYRRHAGQDPFSWRDLYKLVGFVQNPEVPDVVEAAEAIHSGSSGEAGLYERLLKPASEGEKKRDEWHELPTLDIPGLVRRVLPHIVDSPSAEQVDILTRELQVLNTGNEYELHSRDDRVCSKTFSSPVVLKTLSSLDAYSYDLAHTGSSSEETELDVISETGDWLLERNAVFKRHLREVPQIRLIVAFLRDVPKLYKEFPGIEISYQQPWHHNRHMAILRCGDMPKQAIYFARHHRTPYVTPVLLKRRRDIGVLQTTFKDRWEHSIRLKPPTRTRG
jgi:hypothetical protein